MLRPSSRRARGEAAMAAAGAAAAVARGTGAVVPPLPTSPAPAKGRVCIPCRLARVRCDLNVPCERCFRLCIQCKQAVRRRNTRRHADAEEAAGDDDDEEEERSAACTSTDGAQQKDGRKRGRDEAPALPVVDGTPIADLIIERNDPRAAASLYLKSFQRLLQEGHIIRDRVLAMVRVWWVWSLAAGVDVTWGLIGEFTQALHINLVELEGREAVRWGTSAEQRVQRAQRQMEEMGRVSKLLEQRSAFRQADDGAVPMLLFVFGGPPPKGDAAWANDEDLAVYFQACNAPMVALLQFVAFAAQGAMRYKAIQVLTTLGFLAPGDRKRYLLRLQELLFTDTQAITDIFKASFGDGNVRLYIFRARRIELEDKEEVNRVCFLVYIEPCPASRHVTDMPDSFKVRAIKYHKPYQPCSTQALLCPPPASSSFSSVSFVDSASVPTSAPASTAAGAASGPVSVHIPGLAAVPSLTPAAAAAAAAAAGTPATAVSGAALDPAVLFGLEGGQRGIEAGAGGGSMKVEEVEAHGHEHSQSMHRALLLNDAAHQSCNARLHILPTPAPRSSPPTSPLASLSPPFSPPLSVSVASSLSEEVMVDLEWGGSGGGGGGGGGGGMACRNDLRPRWLPAVPVFDEAGMEAIFE